MKINSIKKYWPRSLYGRLAFIWLATLIMGHVLTSAYGYIVVTEDQIVRTDYYLAKDLSILLPQLEAASPGVRKDWLTKMQRQGYSYELNGQAQSDSQLQNRAASQSQNRALTTLKHIHAELGDVYSVNIIAAQQPNEDFRVQLTLHDGTPLSIIVKQPLWPVNWGFGAIALTQLISLIVFTWLAVKQATRPLLELAEAAEILGTKLDCQPIPENGPSEVARAAVAFNAMQTQIKNHLAERVQILASISHDLQTPITRMRLRAELMDDVEQQRKWQADLKAMQMLVEEGITYARSAQKTTEPVCRVDVDALLDSLVCDYVDAGQQVSISGSVGNIIATRSHALKRIITNLLDNALKFATDVEIQITRSSPDQIVVSVLDRGPGIPEHELESVMQPFYRVENSRNRNTGGTGLGLAIAQQLSHALEGSITLRNREGGGLEAQLVFRENIFE